MTAPYASASRVELVSVDAGMIEQDESLSFATKTFALGGLASEVPNHQLLDGHRRAPHLVKTTEDAAHGALPE